MFEMHFAPSKCKLLLHDWIGLKGHLILTGDLDEMDVFGYFGICISPVNRLSANVSLRLQMAQLALFNLGYLWHCHDVFLLV